MIVFWGWDISTSIIGVSVLYDDGDPFKFFMIDLRKSKTMLEKYDVVAERVRQLLDYEVDDWSYHFIEDRLAGFTRGFTNQNTLLKLAQMNAVVTYILSQHERTDGIEHIAPVTAKKLVGLKVPKGGDKKTIAIEFARSSCAMFPYELKKGGKTPKDGVADMADAYVIARAGFLLQEKK